MFYKSPLVDVVTVDSWLVFITYSVNYNILIGNSETISLKKGKIYLIIVKIDS